MDSSPDLTHVTGDGSVTMVDVGDKARTKRIAIAEATVSLSPRTYALLKAKALPKGDVLACARIAGILAAKQTATLIPLCHSLNTTFVDIRLQLLDDTSCVHIESEAHTTAETGVEMEAIVAAEIAAATVYDMCKAVQKDIVISGVRLLFKSGGRSGVYTAEGYTP